MPLWEICPGVAVPRVVVLGVIVPRVVGLSPSRSNNMIFYRFELVETLIPSPYPPIVIRLYVGSLLELTQELPDSSQISAGCRADS